MARSDMKQRLSDGMWFEAIIRRNGAFEYRFTTPETVDAFARARRLERVVGTPPEYEYEHDVEAFFRTSRAVVHPEGSADPAR